MSTPRSTRSGGSDAGTGLIGTTTGVLCFLLLLVVAVQVLFNLYAASAVRAAAFDAARIAAGTAAVTAPGQARRDAEDHVRRVLGRYGADRVEAVTLALDGPDVVVTVTATNPSLLPRLLPAGFAWGTLERSVRVRIEREQQ